MNNKEILAYELGLATIGTLTAAAHDLTALLFNGQKGAQGILQEITENISIVTQQLDMVSNNIANFDNLCEKLSTNNAAC